MDAESVAATRDLCGVVKTLKRLYQPPTQPSAAIDQALEAMTFREARRARRKRQPALASVA